MASLLEELGAKVTTEIATITRLLQANGEGSPSFAESSAVDVNASQTTSKDQASLLAARNELVNAAQDVLRLAQGPIDHVVTLAYASVDTANLNAIVRFQIPQKVPFRSTISLPDLATASGLSEDVLTRTIRFAITNGLFTEPSPGQIGHSAASATLARNKNLHDMTLFNSGFSTRIIVTLGDTLRAQHDKIPEAPDAAFNLAYPGYENLFQYMGKHADAAQEYFTYLDGRSQLPRYLVENVADAWDWASLGPATVVDIGGSSGHTSLALARRFPELKFIVQDINQAGLDMGRGLVAKDSNLQTRVDFTEHDFFQAQPVRADVYFFRHVLHDWSDEDCVKIIRALLPALESGSRVLLSEGVLPEPPSARSGLLEDKQVRFDDYVMLAAHNARERSVEQYTKLFETADPGFALEAASERQVGVHNTLVAYIFKRK